MQIALAFDPADDADAPRPPPPPLRRWWDPLIGCEVATLVIKHQKKRGPKGPRKRPPPAPPPHETETTMPQNENTTTNDAQPNLPHVTYRREVRVKLTDSDMARAGKQLSTLVRDIALLDDKRKAVAAQYSAEIKKLEQEIARLSSAMQDGEELRDLDVYDRYHAGVIEVRRADNHEVVSTRPATVADRETTGSDTGFPEVDEDGPPVDDTTTEDTAGESPTEDDFGGAVARGAGKGKGKGAKVELVESSVGDTVAHMPDDPAPEGEDPWPASETHEETEAPIEPKGKGKKGGSASKKARK